jgi:hypothetical protein
MVAAVRPATVIAVAATFAHAPVSELGVALVAEGLE